MIDIQKIDIQTLLPQRPPFLMVDALVNYDEPSISTAFQVREDCVFVQDGEMLSSGIIENMAQSSAARIGYINKYVLNLPVKIGFIGAVRKLKIHRSPKVGETLVTTITAVQEIFGITLVDAVVKVGEDIIAEASLKTALGEKDAQ